MLMIPLESILYLSGNSLMEYISQSSIFKYCSIILIFAILLTIIIIILSFSNGNRQTFLGKLGHNYVKKYHIFNEALQSLSFLLVLCNKYYFPFFVVSSAYYLFSTLYLENHSNSNEFFYVLSLNLNIQFILQVVLQQTIVLLWILEPSQLFATLMIIDAFLISLWFIIHGNQLYLHKQY